MCLTQVYSHGLSHLSPRPVFPRDISSEGVGASEEQFISKAAAEGQKDMQAPADKGGQHPSCVSASTYTDV